MEVDPAAAVVALKAEIERAQLERRRPGLRVGAIVRSFQVSTITRSTASLLSAIACTAISSVAGFSRTSAE